MKTSNAKRKFLFTLFAMALLVAGAHVAAMASPAEWVVPWGSDSQCTVGSYDINYANHATLKGGTAVDFLNSGNIRLYAPTDGTLSVLQSNYAPIGYAGCKDGRGGYGNHIQIATDDGYQVIMAHLNQVDPALVERFNRGEKRISRGEYIGLMGTSGNSTGIHLHFEIIASRDVFATVFGLGSASLVKGTVITGGVSGNGDSTGGDSTGGSTPIPENTPSATVPTVYMADDKHGSGVNYAFAIGDYTDPSHFGDLGNDQISYLQVPSGLCVTVYENDGFSGSSSIFGEGAYNLEDSGWSNRISSFTVYDAQGAAGTADDAQGAAGTADDYQRAYDQAYAEAYAENYALGYAQGYGDADLTSGGFDPYQYEQEHSADPTPAPTEANPSPAYQQGYQQGLADGNEAGYADGYTEGYVSANPDWEEEAEDGPSSEDQMASLATGDPLTDAAQLINLFSILRSDFDLRQGIPDEVTLFNTLLSPLLIQSADQAIAYTGNDPQWVGCSYFPYETFSACVTAYLDANPDDFSALLDGGCFYYPGMGYTVSQVTLQTITPVGNGYYQADGVLEGISGDDGFYTPLGYAYQAILRSNPDAAYGFVMVAQHTSAAAPDAAASADSGNTAAGSTDTDNTATDHTIIGNTAAGMTGGAVPVEWLECRTVDDQAITVPAIGSVSYAGSVWAYVTGTILEDVPTILNRPKRDLWVEVYTRDEEPAIEMALTPCRSQAEFDELLQDIAQGGASNGTLRYAQGIPYIRLDGPRNTACVLMVIQDIAYYYTVYTPTDELIANWVQAHAAFGLPLDQLELYALGSGLTAAGQDAVATAQSEPATAPSEPATDSSAADWAQLYLDYLQTHLTFDENDDFYIQILALQDYDLDGTPEMLLGIPYGDTSSDYFRGRLVTVVNGQIALYHTADGADTFNFANQLLSSRLSEDQESEQMIWVYHLPGAALTAAYAMESCGYFVFDRDALLIDNAADYSLMSSSEGGEFQSVPGMSSVEEWHAFRDAFLAGFITVDDQPCNRYFIRSGDSSVYLSDSAALYTDVVMEAFNAW